MKNIVLFVADTLRYDYVSPQYMPNISKFKEKSISYTNAKSYGSNTMESHKALVGYGIDRLLRKNGYTGVLIHTNPMISKAKPPLLSFDIGTVKWRKLKRFIEFAKGNPQDAYRRASVVNNAFKEIFHTLLEQGKPFFICAWYMDIHSPYVPPSVDILTRIKAIRLCRRMNKVQLKVQESKLSDEIRLKLLKQNFSQKELDFLQEMYGEEVRCLDQELSEVLDIPGKNDCVTIFTSDHGEEFMEHGSVGHRPNKEFNELRHVPLIINNGKTHETIEPPFHFENFYKLVHQYMQS